MGSAREGRGLSVEEVADIDRSVLGGTPENSIRLALYRRRVAVQRPDQIRRPPRDRG